MATLKKTFIEVDGKQLPTKIYMERRKDVRASIGKRFAILRMPTNITSTDKQVKINWFINWVRGRFEKNPALQTRFFGKDYKTGDLLQVGERCYQINIFKTDKKSHSAKLKNGNISLFLSNQDNDAHLTKSIQHLLSRVVAKDYYPEISRRVNEINNLFFRQAIKSVNLKYNHTNWGSCSTKGNVNLSTRLLFAPADVVDYVIVHELAHLLEMNHSPNFWKLVSDAMPDYEVKEKWLTKHDHLCHF